MCVRNSGVTRDAGNQICTYSTTLAVAAPPGPNAVWLKATWKTLAWLAEGAAHTAYKGAEFRSRLKVRVVLHSIPLCRDLNGALSLNLRAEDEVRGGFRSFEGLDSVLYCVVNCVSVR